MAKVTFFFIVAALLPLVYSSTLKLKPKTCTDVREYYHAKVNGFYSIYDATGNPFTTYCDFESDSGFAWTLVETFTFNRRGYTQFRSSYYYNRPYSECRPNWLAFRLSKPKMVSIYNAKSTTHVRATCNFNPNYGSGLVDHRDYMRVPKCRFSSFFVCRNAWYCGTVDYINVRGYSCRHCKIPFQAYGYRHLHTDLKVKVSNCQDFKVPDAKNGEDVFGYYGIYNTGFRCSHNATSTTNWWLGGNYLIKN